MEPAEYDYMFRLEDTLWWFVAMRRIVYSLFQSNLDRGAIPMQILDAGCGTGGSLRLLERFGKVTAFDFSKQAADFYASRQRGRIVQASVDAIPFEDASFDLVTSFEVICQLPQPADETAIREMARVLKPGGTLFVKLPAFQALYGSHDESLQTKHRYSRSELSHKLESAGLELVKVSYLNTFLFPVAASRRLFAKLTRRGANGSDVRAVGEPLNRIMTAVLAAEAPILKHTDLPFGLSVMALARKP